MSTVLDSPVSNEVTPHAVRAVVARRAFLALGYHPHAAQMKVHNSAARHKVASCGRRFGKSYIGGMELVVESHITRLLLPILEKTEKRREFWVVGPEYSDAAKEMRIAYNALKRLKAPFDRPGTYFNEHSGDMQISMYGGKFLVLGKSSMHPERLIGEGLNGAIMAEAAKQKPATWTRFIRPMLADFRGWSLHTSTPEGRNHFYDLWNQGQSIEHVDWESWRMPSWRNPYVYPFKTVDRDVKAIWEWYRDPSNRSKVIPDTLIKKVDPEIWAQILDLTEEAFNQELAGTFTEFVGRVFKEFDEEVHVKDFEYNPNWPTFAAVDYGFTNPFVWLQIQIDPYDGATYIVDEIHQSRLTIDEAILEIQMRGLDRGVRYFYPDPAEPGDTATIEEKMRIRSVGGTGGEIKWRIRAIRQALRVRNLHLPEGHELRTPRLFVNRRCANTIREMNDYRYPRTYAESDTNTPENPLKKDDHAPEALGRFFAGHFANQSDVGATRVSRADISR